MNCPSTGGDFQKRKGKPIHWMEKNDKKRSFESFTSRERVWSAKWFSAWKSLRETVRSIIYSSLIVRWIYLIMFMRLLYSYFIARRKLGSCKYIILVPMRKRIQCQNMSSVLWVIYLEVLLLIMQIILIVIRGNSLTSSWLMSPN